MFYNHHHAGNLTSLLPAIKRTVITLRGAAGIEHFLCDQYYHGAFYSEENRLLINLNGAVQLKYGKSSYAVDKNQMAFLKSNTRIEYQVNGGNEAGHVEFIIFSMSYELVKEYSTVTLLPPVQKTSSHEIVVSNLPPFLLRFAGSVIPYLEDGIRVEEHLVKIKLLELLYSLKTIDGKFLELFLDFRKETRPNITVIVEENFMNALSVKQLARLTGRSLSSFRREFFSVYNMPPSQWIRERRLKKSRDFLINTNMTVTDICYTLGFENIAHFSRLFKSQFGQSPTGYRLQLLSA